MIVERWAKVCECQSTSTKGAIRQVLHNDLEAMEQRITFTVYPQASCDTCGTPWRKIK